MVENQIFIIVRGCELDFFFLIGLFSPMSDGAMRKKKEGSFSGHGNFYPLKLLMLFFWNYEPKVETS